MISEEFYNDLDNRVTKYTNKLNAINIEVMSKTNNRIWYNRHNLIPRLIIYLDEANKKTVKDFKKFLRINAFRLKATVGSCKEYHSFREGHMVICPVTCKKYYDYLVSKNNENMEFYEINPKEKELVEEHYYVEMSSEELLFEGLLGEI